jgi:hypothetical protein
LRKKVESTGSFEMFVPVYQTTPHKTTILTYRLF